MRNKHGEPRQFAVHVAGDLALRIDLEGTPYESITVAPDDTHKIRVYVTTPGQSDVAQTDETPIRFWIEDLGNGERASVNTIFNGTGDQ